MKFKDAVRVRLAKSVVKYDWVLGIMVDLNVLGSAKPFLQHFW